MAGRILLKLTAMKDELTHYSWRALVRLLCALKLQERDRQITVIYRSNPHLSFAPREIQKINIQQQQDRLEVTVSLNFLGLQGAATPLPIHFTEAIIQDDPEDSNLNAFYDFFNQRWYCYLAAIEMKYAYLPQFIYEGQDPLTQKMAAFAGFLGASANEKNLLPFLNGLTGINLAKGNWCRMIAGFIGCKRAWIAERVPKRLAIPAQHLAKLNRNTVLGLNVSLGAYITQAKNHLELHLSIEKLEAFLPDQPLFKVLQKLVHETMPENLFVTVVFYAKQARTIGLDRRYPTALGWSSKLGRQEIEAYSIQLELKK